MNNYGHSYGYKCNTKHTHEKAPETTRYSNSHARSIFQHELLQTVAVDVRHILLTCAAEWPNVAKWCVFDIGVHFDSCMEFFWKIKSL